MSEPTGYVAVPPSVFAELAWALNTLRARSLRDALDVLQRVVRDAEPDDDTAEEAA